MTRTTNLVPTIRPQTTALVKSVTFLCRDTHSLAINYTVSAEEESDMMVKV
jgi:hypothetical protein